MEQSLESGNLPEKLPEDLFTRLFPEKHNPSKNLFVGLPDLSTGLPEEWRKIMEEEEISLRDLNGIVIDFLIEEANKRNAEPISAQGAQEVLGSNIINRFYEGPAVLDEADPAGFYVRLGIDPELRSTFSNLIRASQVPPSEVPPIPKELRDIPPPDWFNKK